MISRRGIWLTGLVLILLLGTAAIFHFRNASTEEIKQRTVLVPLWNGEAENSGDGWTSPVGPEYFIRPEEGVAHSGSRAVHFHATAKDRWMEWGWRWFPWWPPASGTDLRPYSTLHFALRVSGRSIPPGMHVRLDSPPTGKSKMLPLETYEPKYADGSWHEIRIPLADFHEPGMTYDPAHTTELFFGVWCVDADFEVYLDDIQLLGLRKESDLR